MSGPTNPGSPPPEVPEEFADAYRAAYERALAAQTVGQHREDPAPPDESVDEVEEYDDPAERPLPRRGGPLRVGTHRTPEEYDDDSPTWFEGIRDSTWFVPLLLALLALLLILGAYAVGRNIAGRVDQSPKTDGLVVDSPDGEIQPFTNQKPGKGAWKGKVTRVEDVRAKVGCTSKPGVEADGEPVSYEASNLTDGVADTTWRCNGKAIGVRITLQARGGDPDRAGRPGPGLRQDRRDRQHRPLRREQPRTAGALDHRRHDDRAADERCAR